MEKGCHFFFFFLMSRVSYHVSTFTSVNGQILCENACLSGIFCVIIVMSYMKLQNIGPVHLTLI